MTNPTYATNFSANFNKNWLSTPVAAKQAFHQELADIHAMLISDTPAKDFTFTYQDFNQTVQNLFHIYDDKIQSSQQTPKDDILNTINTSSVANQNSNQELASLSLDPNQLAELESRIYKKLSNQLDDFLSEQMSEISENLKNWLKDALKSEIAAHTTPKTQD